MKPDYLKLLESLAKIKRNLQAQLDAEKIKCERRQKKRPSKSFSDTSKRKGANFEKMIQTLNMVNYILEKHTPEITSGTPQ